MRPTRRASIIAVGVALALVAMLLLPLTWPSERRLKAALAQADRVVVRSGGLCHRRPADEKLLFAIENPADVRAFIETIQIRALPGALRCLCCGDPTFEFYQGGEMVAAIGFHHGKRLRWDGWEADGSLTRQSSAGLVQILREHGLSAEQYD